MSKHSDHDRSEVGDKARAKTRRPPKQRRIEAKRQLVGEAVELLEAAARLLDAPSHWSRKAYALSARGVSLRVDDPRAVRFCLAGALLRSEHLLHGTEIAICTDPRPEVDDLYGPVLPSECPRRLGLALEALSVAAERQLKKLGCPIVALEADESADRCLPTVLHTPLLLGIRRRARLADCQEAIKVARFYLGWMLIDESRLDKTISDAPRSTRQGNKR